jgi:nitroreductase
MLNLSALDLLTTTRSVRQRLDLTRTVPLDVIRECIEIALQAPSGSNAQRWHFVIVTDVAKKRAIADLYREAWHAYAGFEAGAIQNQDSASRIARSADYLALHLHEVPTWVLPCIEGRPEAGSSGHMAGLYGSILPAAWSFMLAARLHGLASCWTTLHLGYEREAAQILGIPFETVTQAALIPVAYPLGTDFKPGARKSLDGVLHEETW